MGKIWDGVARWFAGKKTILGGGLIMASAVAGIWFGKLDPVTGMAVLGTGLSVAGLSAKANRHQAELLTALQGVATVAADQRAGNQKQAIQDAEDTAVKVGLSLVGSGTDGAGK